MSAFIEILLIIVFSVGAGSYIWWVAHLDDDTVAVLEWFAEIRSHGATASLNRESDREPTYAGRHRG